MTQEILHRLKRSLQALASPAEVQVKLFPSFVIKADELALEFDHWYRCAISNDLELASSQKAALGAIDSELEKMGSKKEVWVENALVQSLEWQKVRNLAHAALNAFDWDFQTPSDFKDEYVKSKF